MGNVICPGCGRTMDVKLTHKPKKNAKSATTKGVGRCSVCGTIIIPGKKIKPAHTR